MIAHEDQQRLLHAGCVVEGFHQLADPLVQPADRLIRLFGEGARMVPGIIQVDQVQGGQFRLFPPDDVVRQGGGIVAQPGFLDPSAQMAEALLSLEDEARCPVAQGFQCGVLAGQGMNLREAPIDGPVFAVDRPQDRAASSAGFTHGFKQRGHANMFPLPVPAAAFLRRVGLEGLVLPHARILRFAPRHHRHVDRIGQCGENRLHLPAPRSFPQDAGQGAVRGQPFEIRLKKGVQGHQQHFAHWFLRHERRQ